MLLSPYVLLVFPFFLLHCIEFLWLLLGVETLEVHDNYIIIKHLIFGFGIHKKLLSEKVDGVFISRQEDHHQTCLGEYRRVWFLYFNNGRVAMNYGKTLFSGVNTFRFGAKLHEGEARQIVRLIHEKFPRYVYKPSIKRADKAYSNSG